MNWCVVVRWSVLCGSEMKYEMECSNVKECEMVCGSGSGKECELVIDSMNECEAECKLECGSEVVCGSEVESGVWE